MDVINFISSLNYSAFHYFNAAIPTNYAVLGVALFCARYLIVTIPGLLIYEWFLNRRQPMILQQQFVIRTILSIVVALILGNTIRILFPVDRPFVQQMGSQLLAHAANGAFPSNHGTLMFTMTLCYLQMHRNALTLFFLFAALATAWSRIYLGVHWPLDMVGSLLISVVALLLVTQYWSKIGQSLMQVALHWHKKLFRYWIERGWIN